MLDARSGPLRAPVAPEVPSLQHCLNRMCHWERLDDDAQWRCSSCDKKVRALKRLRPVVLPPLLVVNLVRFKYCEDGSMLKNDRKINFPRVLDARQALVAAGVRDPGPAAPVLRGAGSLGLGHARGAAGSAELAEAQSPVYDLAGIVCHAGKTISRGHYTAFVRSAVTGTWWECDDEYVGRVDAEREDQLAVDERRQMKRFPGW